MTRWLLAVVVPPLILGVAVLVIEVGFGLAGVPAPTAWVIEGPPGAEYLALNPKGPHASRSFRVQQLPLARRPGTVRILCLGGSTTFGHPFEPPGLFNDWLQVRLSRLLPSRRFEVLNFGANGLHSEGILEIARGLLTADMDLIVLYTGHNEFLGSHFDCLRSPFYQGVRLLRSLRSGFWLMERFGRSDADDPVGIANRHLVNDQPLLTAEEFDRGYRNYEENLRELIEAARARGVEVLLCHPASDLTDTPVQYSSFSANVPPAERARFLERLVLLRERRLALETDPPVDRSAWEEWLNQLDLLVAIDGAVPQLLYERARGLLALGREEEAMEYFRRARCEDQHPIRATQRLQDILAGLQLQMAALVADPRPLLEVAPTGGEPLFVDYCHPSLEGHRLIADAILAAMARAGLLAPGDEWRFADEPSIAEYRQLLGVETGKQEANTLARQALFLIGQSYFQAENTAVLATAEGVLTEALGRDSSCALAHVGLGVLACLRGHSRAALDHFDQAYEQDPRAHLGIRKAYDTQPQLRKIFEKAGIEFRDHRARSVRPSGP